MIVIYKAKELFKRDFIKTDSYTTRDEIKKLLKAFKVSFRGRFNPIGQDSQRQEKFWKGLKGTNLVAVRYRISIKDKKSYWHWIIADQSKNGLYIYDPNPKKGVSHVGLTKSGLPDQGSYKNAKWYLKIV